MQRVYLEEDLALIQKYFPGARSVRLRTPFDITNRSARLPRLHPDTFRGTAGQEPGEETVWNH